jgi:hypothetical protein
VASPAVSRFFEVATNCARHHAERCAANVPPPPLPLTPTGTRPRPRHQHPLPAPLAVPRRPPQLSRYAGRQGQATAWFATFAVSWVILRVVLFPRVIVLNCLVLPVVMVAIPYDIDPQVWAPFRGRTWLLSGKGMARGGPKRGAAAGALREPERGHASRDHPQPPPPAADYQARRGQEFFGQPRRSRQPCPTPSLWGPLLVQPLLSL